MKPVKPSVLAGLPPAGSNRLGKEVGRRLAWARAKRHMDLQKAAEQLGIDPGFYYWLETGRVIANDAMYARIRDWILRGTTFIGMGAPSASESAWAPKDEWPIQKMRLPVKLHNGLKKAAQRLGLSKEATVHLAVAQFLSNGALIRNLADAAKEIEEARVTQAINMSPALKDLLAFAMDEKLLARIDEKKPASKLETLKPAIQQVVQIPFEHDERDEWET